MRKAVRAIIIKDDKLVVMHRNKFGTEYDTLPGGNVELGETLEQALYREVEEETMLKFNNPRLVYVEHSDAIYGDQFIYLCDYISGEPELHPNAEERHINKLGKNLYEPKWLPIKELAHAPFLSDALKQKLLDGHASGWPSEAQEFTGTRNV